MRTCLVCLLLVCSAYPQSQTLLNGQPMELARAEALWKAHQYKEAGQLFESLVKIHPKDADIKVRYGRLLLERFNPADAASLFQEALEIKKDHAGALLGMALVAAESANGQDVEARADLQKFLATPRTWRTMAEIQKFDYLRAPKLLDGLRRAGMPEE